MNPSLWLRPTTDDDLDYVLAAESDPANLPYIMQWTRDEHRQAIADPNLGHFVIAWSDLEAAPSHREKRVGYLILTGLQDSNQSIQLRRIVVTEKGKGIGRWAIAQVKSLAFDTYGAHRLWLDVKPFNQRAQTLYRTSGFVEEGTLRDCYKSPNGDYGSLIIMSVLRPEYAASSSSP
ncbi:MAG: N-acetyltransferase [Cyanobacteria bacterium P01_A01_bin.135]